MTRNRPLSDRELASGLHAIRELVSVSAAFTEDFRRDFRRDVLSTLDGAAIRLREGPREVDIERAAERLAYEVWNYEAPNEAALGQARRHIEQALRVLAGDVTIPDPERCPNHPPASTLSAISCRTCGAFKMPGDAEPGRCAFVGGRGERCELEAGHDGSHAVARDGRWCRP